MKHSFRVCIIFFIVLIMVAITYANKDRKGSSDHSLISRMQDFWIAAYQESEYDSHIFRDSANNKISIEGHKYYIEYRLKKGGQEPGRLMILKNHENALKKIGAQIIKRTKKDLYCNVTKKGREIWIKVHALDRLYRLTIVEREQKEQKVVDNPNASSTDTATAAANIHEAAKQGDLEKVKAFLANGENVDLKDKRKLAPLYYAALHGHKDVCEFLVSQGADVNAGREITGQIPLWGALNSRSASGFEIFKLLVGHGADINTNSGSYTLLHQAANSCHDEHVRNIAEFMISKGVDTNAKRYQDKTPLHMVGCREIGELLIAKGADIEARDQYGQTPIFEACSATRNKEVCELLISKGANIEAMDKEGRTPLWKACSHNELRTCELLLLKGANIEAKDKKGRTPLWKACSSNMLKVCELLLSKGAYIESRDKKGRTPLFIACSNNIGKIAELLISKGADVNAKDNRGWTSLRQMHNQCLTTRNTEICDLLKKHGGVK